MFIFYHLKKQSKMDELENDVTTDVDTTVDTETDTWDNTDTDLTVEDYDKEVARREKAEKTIVEMKKQLKGKKVETTWDAITEEKLALREEVNDFLLDNKEMKEYKADILKYREQWFTLKQAKALIENDDVTIENRRKANAMNVTDWEESRKATYNTADLEWMSQDKYNKIMALSEQWKVTIKR